MLLNHRYFFSPNVSPSAREALSDILEFCSTPSLGNYLGFPIKHVSIPQDFRAIIERMQSRFASWKSHLLSFVGRLVLTQAALFTIPSSNMQCSFLLPRITNCVDKLCRDFLWGSADRKKKTHMVSWRKITKP